MSKTMTKPEMELELDNAEHRLATLREERQQLLAERDRLLSENADLQLATAGVTMGADGTCAVISVPIATDIGEQYIPRHVDVKLDDETARSLAAVTKALDLQNACLKSGSRCIKTPDTIRWICEQLAEKIASGTN